jgi:FkbM family methyltransferase
MSSFSNPAPARSQRTGLIAGVLIFALAAGATWFHNAYPRTFGHLLHSRTKGCSISQALEGERMLLGQLATASRFGNSSKLLTKDGAFEQWQTPKGTYWVPAGSFFAVMYDLSEQDRHIYGAGPAGIRTGDVVLDCGANVGVYTREALDHGAKLVVAIEPAPENVEALRRTFAREVAEGRVIVYPKGVWDKDDILTMQIDPKNSARDSVVANLGPGVNSIKVPLTTIDKLTAELNLPRIDFIKMDIEGAETKAVAGAAATIAKYHPRMALCLYHQPTDPTTVPAAVNKAWAGYHLTVNCICSDEKTGPEVGHFN